MTSEWYELKAKLIQEYHLARLTNATYTNCLIAILLKMDNRDGSKEFQEVLNKIESGGQLVISR